MDTLFVSKFKTIHISLLNFNKNETGEFTQYFELFFLN